MPTQPPPQILRYIILDTNIIQHFGNDQLAFEILNILRDAVTKQYGIALSQFSILELIDTASLEIENKRLNALSGLKNFKVKKDILIAAAHLGSLYSEDGMDIRQQPEKGDKIIAATAVLQNALIYTTNAKDFPPPYFKELNRHYLKYTKNGLEVVLVGYFMEPDIEAVIGRYNNRVKEGELQIVPTKEKTE